MWQTCWVAALLLLPSTHGQDSPGIRQLQLQVAGLLLLPSTYGQPGRQALEGLGALLQGHLQSKLDLVTSVLAPGGQESETTEDLIEAAGLPSETHRVVTEDGYILKVHRIPAPGGVPVLYLHGYQSSSAELVLTGRDRSLGSRMAQEGYDVWMINFRGNAYSRNHTVLDPNQKNGPFWNFTWWEMGSNDLPPVLNYVLAQTGSSRLQVVGHSQGMTALYVMLSQYPSLAQKISLISGMAPISYNSHTKGMLKWMAPFLAALPPQSTQSEFLRPTPVLHSLTDSLCNNGSKYQDSCYNMLFLVTGPDLEQQDRSLLPLQLRSFPSGTSGRTIVHTAQGILSGRFESFDFGGGSSATPVRLDRVTPPHAVYVAQDNDYLVQPADYKRLIAELPNVVKVLRVPVAKWNHMDFLVGLDAPRLLYGQMLAEMDKYR